MAQPNVSVKGVKSIEKKLDNILEITIENISEFADFVPDALAAEPYPPELPDQTYIRTGDLADGWESDETTPTSWEITNVAGSLDGNLYAGFVVGEEMQVDIHAGRWWFAEVVIGREFAGMFGEINGNIVKIWEKPN